jgi:hypothetical protein
VAAGVCRGGGGTVRGDVMDTKDFHDISIVPIPVDVAYQLVSNYHYSRVMPKLTSVCFGGEISGELVAIMTLGWGVRPLHTIRKLFPGLEPKDYFEIGKMCLIDDLPRNSESFFMSKVVKEVRRLYPEKKLIFTWADGIMGKPGYVYQAANFYYGGFIWTDTYVTDEGEKVHPRTSKAIIRAAGGNQERTRPTPQQLRDLSIKHYRGKQFRYVYFLRDEKQLMKDSTVKWRRSDYPKDSDLEWRMQLGSGYWADAEMPDYSDNYQYNKVREKAQAVQGSLL